MRVHIQGQLQAQVYVYIVGENGNLASIFLHVDIQIYTRRNSHKHENKTNTTNTTNKNNNNNNNNKTSLRSGKPPLLPRRCGFLIHPLPVLPASAPPQHAQTHSRHRKQQPTSFHQHCRTHTDTKKEGKYSRSRTHDPARRSHKNTISRSRSGRWIFLARLPVHDGAALGRRILHVCEGCARVERRYDGGDGSAAVPCKHTGGRERAEDERVEGAGDQGRELAVEVERGGDDGVEEGKRYLYMACVC